MSGLSKQIPVIIDTDPGVDEALIHPERNRFIRCTPEVNTADLSGRTFLVPDEKGNCFFLDVKNASDVIAVMLCNLFPER